MKPEIEVIRRALEALRQGKMIIVTDDPNRENEGDLIFPAACWCCHRR